MQWLTKHRIKHWEKVVETQSSGVLGKVALSLFLATSMGLPTLGVADYFMGSRKSEGVVETVERSYVVDYSERDLRWPRLRRPLPTRQNVMTVNDNSNLYTFKDFYDETPLEFIPNVPPKNARLEEITIETLGVSTKKYERGDIDESAKGQYVGELFQWADDLYNEIRLSLYEENTPQP